MTEVTLYRYHWGAGPNGMDNPVRAALKGRRCKLLATGKRNTALIEMVDTGELVTTSRRALRKEGG